MATAPQLLESLGRVFGDGVECEVARRLLDFLSKHSRTTYINLQLVRQITPGATAGAHDSAILRTLQFLSGDAVRLLDAQFELFDAEDHPHKLTNEEARTALSYEVNPLTGERDPAIRQKVAIYFAPTEEARNILGEDSRSRGT